MSTDSNVSYQVENLNLVGKDPTKQSRFYLVGILGVLLPLISFLGYYLAHHQLRRISHNSERARIVFDSIGDAVIVTDASGRVEHLNMIAQKMMGWPQEDAQGKLLTEIFPIYNEQTGEIVDNPVEIVLREGRTVGLANHTMLSTRDGRNIPIEDSAAPVKDEHGNVNGVVLVFHDVSERHAAQLVLAQERHQIEQQLRQRMRQTQAIADLSGAVSHAKDLERIYTVALDAIEQTIGCERASVLLFDPDGVIRFKAWRGISESYRQRFTGHSPWRPDEKNAQPILVSDTETWKEEETLVPHILQEGIRALGFIPLEHENRLLGKFMVYFNAVHEFNVEEVQVMQTIARLVGHGINQKQSEEDLKLAAEVFHSSSEAMVITDAENIIISVNPAFTEITGYSAQEAVGKNPRFMSSGKHDQAFYRAMWESLKTTGSWRGEICNLRKNGEELLENLCINTLYNNDGSVRRRVALFNDISEQKRTRDQLEHQASFDDLTGLPNRRLFLDRLSQAIKGSCRTELPLALLFLDLDHFKEVNDTLGHNIGDLLLKETAQRLSSCVRETDTVARLSGDEFTVILSGLSNLNIIQRVAGNICASLAAPFHLAEDQVFVSASIGITLYPNDADTVENLLKHADQAMYVAKATGRNQYSYFTPTLQEAAETRMRLVNELRGALAKHQLMVYYQPIIELSTNRIDKAEALIRWKHPKFGMVSPAEFIPIAEETGLICEIGDWVFQQAAQLVKYLQENGCPSFQISVNESPVQFHNRENNVAEWLTYLRQLGMNTDSIVVEITEGVLLDNMRGETTNKLLAMSNAGIQLSLDDFGTGYSSLSYLKKYDIDYLKIDQSFVREMSYGNDDHALCEAIIVMAHKLGIKVIAEGVETSQQRDLLLAMRCDYVQGYLFSRPVPVGEFKELLGIS